MLKAIAVSLLLIAIGAAATYFCIYQPYDAMAHHSGDVSYSLKGQFLGPVALVAGLCFLVAAPFGAATGISKPWAHQRGAEKIVVAAALILGLAASAYVCLVWFPEAAQAFGYAN